MGRGDSKKSKKMRRKSGQTRLKLRLKRRAAAVKDARKKKK